LTQGKTNKAVKRDDERIYRQMQLDTADPKA